MANSKILFDNLIRDLKGTNGDEEIQAIAFAVLAYLGISRADVLSQKGVDLEYAEIRPIAARLKNQEPLQYILNEAWFDGHKFQVDPAVLIPRPETELLVEEAAKFVTSKKEISIVDIGTGSGCIAISLALRFPHARVFALDVSLDALRVARRNAETLGAQVEFLHHNILQGVPGDQKFDLIVSNPPYVALDEKHTLSKNVVDFEPHLALFADANDPLIFYRAIAAVSAQLLRAGGKLMVEINQRFALDVKSVVTSIGLADPIITKDLAGNDRFVTASSPWKT